MSSEPKVMGGDQKTKDHYSKILIQNGIQSSIKKVEIVIPKLSDDFTADYETVKIQFEDEGTKVLELFVKKFIPDNEESVGIREMRLFEKEANFFNTLLPQVNKFCLEKIGNCDLLEKILPKSFYADENVIIMENLRSKGFKMLPENETHTFERAKKVIEMLGILHATSYALIESEGQEKFLEKYPFTREAKRWSKVGRDSHEPWLNRLVHGAVQILRLHPVEGSQKLLDYLTEYGMEAFEKFIKYFDWKNNRMRCGLVLNHGDAWNCNVLFNEESGDCILIDFQTIHVGSPALDLVYYVYVTVQSGVRKDEWKNFLRIYYDLFREIVERLGGTVKFSFDDLVSDYLRCSEMGFLMALDPVYFFEWEETVQVTEYVGKILEMGRGEFYAREIVKEFEIYQRMINDKSWLIYQKILCHKIEF